MAAGYAITAGDVNTKAGALVTSLWDGLEAVNRFYKWLADSSHNDAYLNGIGITGATATAGSDVAVLRSSISDLGNTTNGLWAVAHGLSVPGGANNFFFNAKALTGVNYTG